MNTDYRTSAEILQALSKSLRERRLDMRLDQATAAARAGIGVRSWRDLERGAGSTLDTFLRAAKVLGFSADLESLIAPPAPTLSPMAMLEASQRKPKRIRVRRSTPREA